MLKLYNSLGRKLEEFRPIKKGEVRMYTCGPTVWNYAHIGNYRTFTFYDLLRRYLKFKGYKVIQVMNITDVEDRIIKGVKQFGKPRAELTSFYEQAFKDDLATLGIEQAEHYPHPTENIDDIVNLVKVLIDRGYAYKAQDGSVYFDVSKFRSYGALSGVKLGTGKAAGRMSMDHYEEKKEAADFALWKAWDPDDGEVFWNTELGKGRPGWHIECSAMSMKYLGPTFDIHSGGKDLRFPHHENEIAQSEAATGRRFVNYWLHSEFVNMEGEEMHKSIGNVVLLRDLLQEGWDPLTVRMFLISARYRDPVDLTEAALEQARAQKLRLQEAVGRISTVTGSKGSHVNIAMALLADFTEAMDDDLNTPSALAALFVSVKKANTLIDSGELGADQAASILGALRRVNSVLGVMTFEEEPLPKELEETLTKRAEARQRKDFAESDRLRDVLYEKGIVVEDTPSGTRWKRRSG